MTHWCSSFTIIYSIAISCSLVVSGFSPYYLGKVTLQHSFIIPFQYYTPAQSLGSSLLTWYLGKQLPDQSYLLDPYMVCDKTTESIHWVMTCEQRSVFMKLLNISHHKQFIFFTSQGNNTSFKKKTLAFNINAATKAFIYLIHSTVWLMGT